MRTWTGRRPGGCCSNKWEKLRRLCDAKLRGTYLRKPGCHEVTGDAGTVYYLETEAFRDDRKGGHLRARRGLTRSFSFWVSLLWYAGCGGV